MPTDLRYDGFGMWSLGYSAVIPNAMKEQFACLKTLSSREKEQNKSSSARGRWRPEQRRPSRKTEFSVQVSGLLPRISWQDLKDHFREHQVAVTYADVRSLTLDSSTERHQGYEHCHLDLQIQRQRSAFRLQSQNATRVNVCVGGWTRK